MEFLLKLLIFFLIFIFLKYRKKIHIKSQIQNTKNLYPIFTVVGGISKIKHNKYKNSGESVSFTCEGQIKYLGNFFYYSNLLLNDDFYQLCYFKYINKNAGKRC